MKQKKSRLLLFAWVILVLGLMIFTDTSNAGDGDDLVEVAYTGNLTKIRALLKKGVDVDYKDRVSETALMAASQTGHEAIVQTLLANDAKIDQPSKKGATALMKASQNGHEAIVQILLDKGAKVNLREDGGGTALKFAGTQQIKQLLKAAGATE